jgi:hypothetical protein
MLFTGLCHPYSGKAQIYGVGNDDGFSFVCAGSVGNELFLPITLQRFEAICSQDGIRISWSLSDEIKNKDISLETSSDGRYFTAVLNNEYSQSPTFEYTDYSKARSTRYYRLAQKRGGQTPEYSHIITASCRPVQSTVSPNPSARIFTLQLEEPIGRIVIRDITGKSVFENSITQSTQKIDVGFLNPGIYSLEINNEYSLTTQRIVIDR